MKILCLGNQKGGVSKSTASLNIAYSLANTYDQKVLLVDCDSQGSSSLNLGIPIDSEDIHTLDKILEPVVLNKVQGFSWEAVKQCIYTPTYQDRERDPDNAPHRRGAPPDGAPEPQQPPDRRAVREVPGRAQQPPVPRAAAHQLRGAGRVQ